MKRAWIALALALVLLGTAAGAQAGLDSGPDYKAPRCS